GRDPQAIGAQGQGAERKVTNGQGTQFRTLDQVINPYPSGRVVHHGEAPAVGAEGGVAALEGVKLPPLWHGVHFEDVARVISRGENLVVRAEGQWAPGARRPAGGPR